jgi:hypothetical protein
MTLRPLPLVTLLAALATTTPAAWAHGPRPGPGSALTGDLVTVVNSNTGGTSTTPPSSTATIPTTAISFDQTFNCRGGGTQAMKGSYDPTNGALTSSVTLSKCVVGWETHDGTISTTGTLVSTTSTTYTLALTSTYDTTVTNGTDSVARKCTWSKNGTYDMTAQTFTGTVSKSNCGLTLTETQRGDIVQHLLRDSLQLDH